MVQARCPQQPVPSGRKTIRPFEIKSLNTKLNEPSLRKEEAHRPTPEFVSDQAYRRSRSHSLRSFAMSSGRRGKACDAPTSASLSTGRRGK
jgi:hypothetical protein